MGLKAMEGGSTEMRSPETREADVVFRGLSGQQEVRDP